MKRKLEKQIDLHKGCSERKHVWSLLLVHAPSWKTWDPDRVRTGTSQDGGRGRSGRALGGQLAEVGVRRGPGSLGSSHLRTV